MFQGLLLQTATSNDIKQYKHRVSIAQPITGDPSRAGMSVVEIQVDDGAYHSYQQAVGKLVDVDCKVEQRTFGKTTYTNFVAKALKVLGEFRDFVAQPDGTFKPVGAK